MKKIVITILLSIASPAIARIGETPAECKARYGEPLQVDKNDQSVVFEKAGFQIIVFFWKDVVHQIMFAKKERDAIGEPLAMSKEEISKIVASNTEGLKLVRGDEGGILDTSYETEDGKILAVYFAVNNILVISTKEYALEKKKKEEAEKIKNLEGF